MDEPDQIKEQSEAGEHDQRDQLLQRAMRACSTREYCISDIGRLLERWGADDETKRKAIIERLTEERFIDEERYSRAYVNDHLRYNRWGRIRITMGLRQKQVNSSTIAEAVAAIDEDEYREILEKIIMMQLKRVRAGSRSDLKIKLIRHAIGKGFESSLVYEMVERIMREEGNE